MVARDEMIRQLKEFLIDELLIDMPAEEISESASLGNDIGVDSLGFTELMAYLEDTYQIKIKDDEFSPDNFRTLNAVVHLIETKQMETSYV